LGSWLAFTQQGREGETCVIGDSGEIGRQGNLSEGEQLTLGLLIPDLLANSPTHCLHERMATLPRYKSPPAGKPSSESPCPMQDNHRYILLTQDVNHYSEAATCSPREIQYSVKQLLRDSSDWQTENARSNERKCNLLHLTAFCFVKDAFCAAANRIEMDREIIITAEVPRAWIMEASVEDNSPFRP
jgi:hypothetical protein